MGYELYIPLVKRYMQEIARTMRYPIGQSPDISDIVMYMRDAYATGYMLCYETFLVVPVVVTAVRWQVDVLHQSFLVHIRAIHPSLY